MSENNVMALPTAPDDLVGKFLTFQIEKSIYGIELFHVIEIISIQSITTVPHVPSYIKGIINLRGKIIPVVDVRLKFSLPERAYDDKTCIVVVNVSDLNVGLIVDNVSEVASVESENLSGLPEFNKVNINKFLKSISKTPTHVILNIDCEKFLYDELAATVY